MGTLIKLTDSYGTIYINPMMIESLVQQELEGREQTIINMYSGRTHVVRHTIKEVIKLMKTDIYKTIVTYNNPSKIVQPEYKVVLDKIDMHADGIEGEEYPSIL